MEESNMSEDDVRKKEINQEQPESDHKDNAKRLKTDNDSLDKSDESSSKESTDRTVENELASTSNSDSGFLGFPKGKNTRNRNYRISRDDESSANESALDDHISESNDRTTNSILDLSSENSNSTAYVEYSPVIPDSDTESEGEPSVLKKEKPKHKWIIVNELVNRQMGSSNKFSSDLFQSRCYGSLHCVQRLELMYKLEKHQGCVNSLNFHPDGSLLASGSDDLKVVIWDWQYGQSLLSFETKHRGNVFQSKFMPLGGDLHIATCARDGQVRLAQISYQEGLRSNRKLGSHRGPCHKLAVLKDQPQILLSAGEDGIIFRHDLRESKPNKVTKVKHDGREVGLYSINSHPLNSHEFCVGGRDYMVRSYDQRKCGNDSPPLRMYYPFKKSRSCIGCNVTCAIYNHNGSEILASYNDEDIYLFDVNEPEQTFVHKYMGHRNGATIKGVNFFGPNSEYIVSGSDCGNVFFWDRNTEAIVQWFFADDNGVVNCLEPHPQVPFLCTSGLDWDVKVWVPSFEQEPILTGLEDTVKENVSARSRWTRTPEFSDSRTLWMLWRHLSSRESMRSELGAEHGLTDFSSGNSSSISNLSRSDSDDDSDGPPGCTTT